MKSRKVFCFKSLILLECPILTSKPHRKRLDHVLISSTNLQTICDRRDEIPLNK